MILPTQLARGLLHCKGDQNVPSVHDIFHQSSFPPTVLILSSPGLWAAKMNLKGTSGLATDDDLVEYETRLEALDQELERRKDLGRQFQAVLNRQAVLLEDDEASREKHQVRLGA